MLRTPRRLALRVAAAALALLPAHGLAHSQPAATPPVEGTEGDPAAAEVEPPPTWRFRDDGRPVKVVVLAGSIGAYKREPYSEQIERMCPNVEVRNIAKTGLGAWALKKRFEQQVLDNANLRWNVEGQEYWLVFGGGLNSVGSPHSSNNHMRRLFELAHRRGMKVIGLSLSPWGDEGDKRWRGLAALKSRHNTAAAVDFVMGRLSPREALGNLAAQRKGGADAPWDPSELPDIGIDLYDSPLRDRDALPRDLDEMRELLASSREWKAATDDLDELQRQTKLEADALELSETPRWYLRPELRSFDHIHPNADGHRIIAETMCPQMPASWGCSCAPAASPAPDPG